MKNGATGMALDNREGVWKSGKGRGRKTPKGRQYEDQALQEVHALLEARVISRDLLIEFLHLIQDAYGHLSAPHLRALAEIMRLSMAEVYEVATFYAHFDIIKEDEAPPPALTIRVCDGLSCELKGAKQLKDALEDGLDPNEVRVLRAPCMGRCDTAPTLELGHRHIDQATIEKVKAAIKADDTYAEIPSYETLAGYRASGGYTTLETLRKNGNWEEVQEKVLASGLRGLGGALSAAPVAAYTPPPTASTGPPARAAPAWRIPAVERRCLELRRVPAWESREPARGAPLEASRPGTTRAPASGRRRRVVRGGLNRLRRRPRRGLNRGRVERDARASPTGLCARARAARSRAADRAERSPRRSASRGERTGSRRRTG